jgi:hypothetical protein
LAEEHAAVLREYRPVLIEFCAKRDPFIAKILEEEYEAERQSRAVWEKKWQEDRRQRDAELQERRRKHPRFGEWPNISRAELERLVWTKPTQELADEFGVSDVAIGKQCKALGIKKPPVGFWNKVRAGKIAHPNGKPGG